MTSNQCAHQTITLQCTIILDAFLMLSGVKVSGAGMGNSLVGLTYYSNNEDDPYITLKEEVCHVIH